MNNEENSGISIEEAIRLKNELNKKISYGNSNLNAREIEELRKIDKKKLEFLESSITTIKESWWVTPTWLWKIVALISFVTMLFFTHEPRILLAGGMLLITSVYHLSYREGLLYGFTRGYEDGNYVGVNKALGITEEEEKEIRETSIEMQMDQMLIDKLDEN